MAVTAAQKITKSENCHRQSYPVEASTTIYGGTLVFIDDGYAQGVITGATGFAGVAVETVDNSSGSNGDLNVEVYEDGKFLLTGSGLTQADVGKACYATDNYTITATASTNPRIGTFKELVSSTKAWVQLNPHVDITP